MIPINRTYAPIQAFVDELARCGMRHAVTSPGSRNAPLALTLAAQPGIDAVSVIDERSAGFVALGMAKASGRPVAVTCTSGTAAANLHPAVVEAWEARVPLIVLTADRPPELREVGAGQAIDQLKLYGSAAKWFVEVGTHEPGPRDRRAPSRARLPRLLDGARRQARARAPELPAARAARARARGADRGRLGGPAGRRRPGPSCASTRARRTRTTCTASPSGSRAPPRRDRVRPRRGPGGRARRPAGGRRRAGRCWPSPPPVCAAGDHDRSHVVAHYDVLLRAEGFAAAHAARAGPADRATCPPRSRYGPGWPPRPRW